MTEARSKNRVIRRLSGKRRWYLPVAVTLVTVLALAVVVGPTSTLGAPSDDGVRPCDQALEARHNPFGAMPDRGHICFDAYISAFEDTLPENGRPLGIPIWVSYEIDRGKPAETSQPRPSRWYTVQPLVERKIAPTDASYATTITFRRANSNWYERGHLAPKFLAERLGEAAARFTHNVVNAVPQRGRFNRGPWFELECKTGAWANEYGAVWVIAGPIFLNGHPAAWLAPDGAMPVAIPDGLFKVVARKVSIGGGDQYEILAFIYPQDSPLYEEQHWDDINWRTTVKRIEEVTGLRLVNAGVTYTDAPTNGPWPQHRKDFDPGCARFAPGSDSDATATR